MCCNNEFIPSINNNVDITNLYLSREISRRNFATISDEDLITFESILGPEGVCQDAETLQCHNVDCYRTVNGQSKLLLLPKSTEDVSRILKHCNDRNLAVTPQGGNTGLVAGSVSVFDEIIISTTRMKDILGIDELTGFLTSQSGVTLLTLNEYAGGYGFLVPLDLAPNKYCQIGGNVATNAGGLRYFRYGSLHANVVGLEVVLANGEILDLMNCMKKDNTGYDLKQLLIGSEGTLGVITKVAIQCPLKPKSVACILLGLESFDEVIQAFQTAKSHFQESLTCCELMDDLAMECVTENMGLENPVAGNYKYFILMEYSTWNSHKKENTEAILREYLKDIGSSVKSSLALESDSIAKIWKLRRGIGMAVLSDGYAYKYDFSIPLEKFPVFLEEVRGRVGSKVTRCCGFGHLGDSNIHLVVTTESYSEEVKNLLEPFLYEWVGSVRGSISAEHGIGLKERKYLKYSKSPQAIQLMKRIKNVFDPKGILNPYKIFMEED